MRREVLVLLERLISEDGTARRDAASELVEVAENQPGDLEHTIPDLLNIIASTTDDFVAMQSSLAIKMVCEANTQLSKVYSIAILKVLEALSTREMTEKDTDTMINAAGMFLFETQHQLLITDSDLLSRTLPLLVAYIRKDGSVRYAPYKIIAQVSSQNPALLGSIAGEMIDLVEKGMVELCGSLYMLYQVQRPIFHQKMDALIRIFETREDARTMILTILQGIARDQPSLISPHVPLLLQYLNSPLYSANIAMILGEVSRESPEAVYEHLDRLQGTMKGIPMLKSLIPPIFGHIGRQSEARATEMLAIMRPMLDEADPTVVMLVLQEFRNLGQMNRELLMVYIPKIRTLAGSPEQYVRDLAQAILDYFEGRDLRSLAMKIEEQNRLIRESAVSVEALKMYLDQNIELLKQYISEIVKKLPVPVRLSTEGRVQKILRLHFICAKQGERCLYPTEGEFSTETRQWNKWLKIAVSSLSLGLSVLNPLDGGAVDQVRTAYEAYRTGEDKEFLAFVNEPFLTSVEQDSLVQQLRDAKFFDVFSYDTSLGNWVCLMCKSDN